MGKVIMHVSISVDGFMTGPQVSVSEPLGVGGQRLHEWLLKDDRSEVDSRVVSELFAETGAVVLGRRTFDVGLGEWEDTPYPVPSFVVTHERRPELEMKSGSFSFVHEGGVARAIELAKAAAGDRHVTLMGAEVSQQALNAGLVDEIRLQIVPVLMGSGRLLFEHLQLDQAVELEQLEVAESPSVTHLRYRVASKR